MNTINRLDKIWNRITNKQFLNNEGLANELGFYVFDYDAKDELIVREYVESLKKKLSSEEGITIIEFDLYDILIQYLKEEEVLDRVFALEKRKGKEKLEKSIEKMASPEMYIEYMSKIPHNKGDIIFITGVGKVYPYVRAHMIFNNIQHKYEDVPVIMFYPGSYTGKDFTLFNRLEETNYYRAFRLLD